jgi:hypothetical protein
MTTEHVIRWSTAGAVLGVAAVAAVASYEHAYDLVRMNGESGWTARMVPLMVDGLIYASSMVLLDSARRKTVVPVLARGLLKLYSGVNIATDGTLASSRSTCWPPRRLALADAWTAPTCPEGTSKCPFHW